MQYGKQSSPPQENRPRPKKETIVFQLQPSIFMCNMHSTRECNQHQDPLQGRPLLVINNGLITIPYEFSFIPYRIFFPPRSGPWWQVITLVPGLPWSSLTKVPRCLWRLRLKLRLNDFALAIGRNCHWALGLIFFYPATLVFQSYSGEFGHFGWVFFLGGSKYLQTQDVWKPRVGRNRFWNKKNWRWRVWALNFRTLDLEIVNDLV